ncbi:unnamed protein product, partial [Brassica oleracea]
AGCSYIAAYTKACGRVDVDGSRHLLGDHAGLIHLLAITTHEKEKCVENNYGLNSSYKFVPRRMSRLGCQVIARPELDGLRLAIPSATRNFAVDRFVLYSGTLEPEAAQPHRDDYCSFDNFDGCLLRENSVITYLWSCLCVSFSV